VVLVVVPVTYVWLLVSKYRPEKILVKDVVLDVVGVVLNKKAEELQDEPQHLDRAVV